MTSASVICHGFSCYLRATSTPFSRAYLSAGLACLQDMFSMPYIRTVAWLKAVSASPRGFFPRAGNLRGVTRTLLAEEWRCLPIASSVFATGEAWPACDAGLSLYIAASYTSSSACAQKTGAELRDVYVLFWRLGFIVLAQI